MSRAQAVAAALLAGLLIGAWGGARLDRDARRRSRRQGPNVEKVVKRFERDLKLDAAQTVKVREILESRRGRHEALRKESDERFRALRVEMDVEIEKLLTEEQKARFAETRARWEKKADAR